MNRLFFSLALPALILSATVAYGQNAQVQDVQTAMGTREQLIVHEGYTLSYNSAQRLPNWVAYEITKEKLSSHKTERIAGLRVDPQATGAQATVFDYEKGGNYDPGLLVSADDMLWSKKAAEESTYLSTACPMAHALYDGAWFDLEIMCRKWAEKYGPLYVVSGPLFVDGVAVQQTIGETKLLVPHAFFKVVAQKRGAKWCAAGFIFTNTNHANHSLTEAAKCVRIVELLTGHDFFWRLPQDVQDAMEINYDASEWSMK